MTEATLNSDRLSHGTLIYGLYARLRERVCREEQLIEHSAHIGFEQCRARLKRLENAGSDELYRPGSGPAA